MVCKYFLIFGKLRNYNYNNGRNNNNKCTNLSCQYFNYQFLLEGHRQHEDVKMAKTKKRAKTNATDNMCKRPKYQRTVANIFQRIAKECAEERKIASMSVHTYNDNLILCACVCEFV